MPTVLQKGNTFYAQKGSYFEGNVKIDGDFIVPAHTHFWGRLTVTGSLELGSRSSVALDVSCWNAVIGSQCRIKGPVTAHGDVYHSRSCGCPLGGGRGQGNPPYGCHRWRCKKRGCHHRPRQDQEREPSRQEHEGSRGLRPGQYQNRYFIDLRPVGNRLHTSFF